MINRTSLIFCIGSVAVAAAVFSILYPLMAISPERLAYSRSVQPAEKIGEVDLGPGFGRVSVIDLAAYWVENPPAAAQGQGGAVSRPVRFGGC